MTTISMPILPCELWMEIMKIEAVRQRKLWWNALSEEEQQYEEWPLDIEEHAQGLVEDLFGGQLFRGPFDLHFRLPN
jgi:hypothetical protein